MTKDLASSIIICSIWLSMLMFIDLYQFYNCCSIILGNIYGCWYSGKRSVLSLFLVPARSLDVTPIVLLSMMTTIPTNTMMTRTSFDDIAVHPVPSGDHTKQHRKQNTPQPRVQQLKREVQALILSSLAETRQSDLAHEACFRRLLSIVPKLPASQRQVPPILCLAPNAAASQDKLWWTGPAV